MFPKKTNCLFLIICVFALCTCSSSRTLRSKSGFTIYSARLGWKQVLLVLEKLDKTYEMWEIVDYSERYYDRREMGYWRKGHDTLYLYPQWELDKWGEKRIPADLSQKENINCYNMEKRFIVHKKQLVGIKSNMPSSLDSIVNSDFSNYYNCDCEKMELSLVSDFYMKSYDKIVYK